LRIGAGVDIVAFEDGMQQYQTAMKDVSI